MTQAQLAALLGRPLTSIEVTNYDLYLKIAKEYVEELLCVQFNKVTEDRTFDIREGYSTVFTDIFTDIESVVVNGVTLETTEYSPRQWDKRNAKWYNSIILEGCTNDDEVTIVADWGFGAYCPSDLHLLIAKAFDLNSKHNATESKIQRKEVEDFSITFEKSTQTDDEKFLSDNQIIINKYSQCNIGNLQHGEVCKWNRY